MPDYLKPLPEVDERSRPFWEGAKRHQLMVYRCLTCGASYYPAAHCTRCQEPRMEWVSASGKGQVYTFAVFHQLYHAGFVEELPYNVTVVELAEGPYLLSNLIGCPNEEIRVGMPVEVVFEDVNSEITLPKFRPPKS